ncbi:Na(+)-translocating NADH-quinone reductase subunit A [Zhongshania aliphaticivorans]|uniref:Na(+)-translocating NADH-quinone reductase subunit A n=1 Tax=Zhongshania aliphaticivorans TaxID=1470434 RepID=A0A5S9QEQ0_9GAMM|nr:Na(+)-translocating NADH-quinone reductase subunit A [Zhongshania aliphaticivorans]CAA0088334.1 Na(+)-translocating NADH-quinone reductase subunit A [Zhongshania aliphaticivorans]CAA0116381.1 Na(+)-translocating NADH-quinone reductase subunit A [Zhongshania aliphaticivorans]CAA0120435.1 Na(+)-translocating NADH-quinone reductase subunit A [Zhongshania aliphaticivorans]
MIKITRGLDLPISGVPDQRIELGSKVRSVAVVGFDYIGMKPTMAVKTGDRVKTGQVLFTDKKNEGVRYTSPATGLISAINRGEKRVLQSVVIDVEEDEFESFAQYDASSLATLTAEQVTENLVESGLWTAFRTRPFSRVPSIGSNPAAIFVTAIDTHPLAGDPAVIIAKSEQDFSNGLELLCRLTTGKVHLCVAPDSNVPSLDNDQLHVAEFGGVHPAGLAGTHIHFLEGASASKVVWSIGYQDVIAIGKLFTTGKLSPERVVSLAGPQVEKPRLLETRLGVSLDELCAGQVLPGDNRVISGSVLGGRTARGATAFLGRYHNQVTVLAEGNHREFMGWLSPGVAKHSSLRIYLSQFLNKRIPYTTNTNGSERAMVPVGAYEKVMPLDILPTQLLRSLIVGDTQVAQTLGCLELDEEDLALCTYVCPGKYEYGPILRDNLSRIEKEG